MGLCSPSFQCSQPAPTWAKSPGSPKSSEISPVSHVQRVRALARAEVGTDVLGRAQERSKEEAFQKDQKARTAKRLQLRRQNMMKDPESMEGIRLKLKYEWKQADKQFSKKLEKQISPLADKQIPPLAAGNSLNNLYDEYKNSK